MEINRFLEELGYVFGPQVRVIQELPDMEDYFKFLLKKEAEVFARLPTVEKEKRDMVYKLWHSMRGLLAQCETKLLTMPFACEVCHQYASYRSHALKKNWCIRHYCELYETIRKAEDK